MMKLILKKRFATLFALVMLVIVTPVLFGGCQWISRVVPGPSRTLPTWIQRVYVPMFKNQSGNYGLQVPLTQAVVDEFLIDGRLKVSKNDRADVRVEGTIISFDSTPESSTGDDITLTTRLTMQCKVRLYDPYATDRSVPVATYTVTASTRYISDTRRMISRLEETAYDDLYSQMAYNIVQTVMSGRPDAPTAQEQQAMAAYKAKNNAQQFEPDMNAPKMPRFVPKEDR